MKKIRIRYYSFYIILVIVLAITTLLTVFTKVQIVSSNKDIMVNASTKTKECFNAIKQYKKDNKIEIPDYDILETGMIGIEKKTPITTTEGELGAKRTSTNPNWAAVIVSYFEKANLKEGDQVGIVCSGSFPSLNIASVCAAEAYGLDYCLMVSIGASYYGANDPNFTNLEIFTILYENNLISKLPDIISLGGANDVGEEFYRYNDVRNEIINRISNSPIEFLYEEDYEQNINKRIDKFNEVVPNMKLLISCGGSLVAMGKNNESFLDNGFFKGDSSYNYQKNKDTGLIGYYKSIGVSVASLINIKYLALQNNIPFDPNTNPIIGLDSNCNAYYITQYKLYIPIIGLVVSIGILVYICIFRKKHKEDLIKVEDKSYNLK